MENELYHHGIKGQKWGVRRYQNRDGTLTSAGRKHHTNDGTKQQVDKKKIAKTSLKVAAAVGTTALAAYAFKNPEIRKMLSENASKAVSSIKDFATSEKTKNFVKTNGQKTLKSVSDSVKKTGKAMSDAALASFGTIAIAEVASKYQVDENATKAEKYRSQMIIDTATAGIKSATASGNTKSGDNKSKGGNVGADVSSKIGAPSNKGVDKSSTEYQNLFKGRDSDTRSTIKSLVSAGYDINQINEYLNNLSHSELNVSIGLGKKYIEYLIG